MNDEQNNVALSVEQIDEITTLIKSGKTIEEIGETLYQKYVEPKLPKKARRPRKPKMIELLPTIDTHITKQNDKFQIEAEVEYHLDGNKKITLRATSFIDKDTNDEIAKTHQDLYIKLLYSLNNIISITP